MTLISVEKCKGGKRHGLSDQSYLCSLSPCDWKRRTNSCGLAAGATVVTGLAGAMPRMGRGHARREAEQREQQRHCDELSHFDSPPLFLFSRMMHSVESKRRAESLQRVRRLEFVEDSFLIVKSGGSDRAQRSTAAGDLPREIFRRRAFHAERLAGDFRRKRKSTR